MPEPFHPHTAAPFLWAFKSPLAHQSLHLSHEQYKRLDMGSALTSGSGLGRSRIPKFLVGRRVAV